MCISEIKKVYFPKYQTIFQAKNQIPDWLHEESLDQKKGEKRDMDVFRKKSEETLVC